MILEYVITHNTKRRFVLAIACFTSSCCLSAIVKFCCCWLHTPRSVHEVRYEGTQENSRGITGGGEFSRHRDFGTSGEFNLGISGLRENSNIYGENLLRDFGKIRMVAFLVAFRPTTGRQLACRENDRIFQGYN